MADPAAPAPLRGLVEALLDEAGYDPAELGDLTFGDVDSLLVAEVVLLVEADLGRELAIEAFVLDTPLHDLLVIADGDRPPPCR